MTDHEAPLEYTATILVRADTLSSVCAERRRDSLRDRILRSIWRQEHSIVADRHSQPLVRIRPGNGAARARVANGLGVMADLTAKIFGLRVPA